VVKLGTGVLTSGAGRLNEDRIAAICGQIAGLRRQGTEVIVVTSGAIGLGMGRLGLAKRPKEVTKKQACAAIGQSLLMQTWQRAFEPHGIIAAQVLLIHDDLRVRSRYLAARQTFERLFDYGAVPVVNENDTVSAAEIMIKFGENDTLSAMVSSLVQAQYLVILSTAPGLIDMKGTGKVVPVVEKITPEIEAMAGGTTSETAIGGMISKISAAKLAAKSGCGVFIASGAEPEVLNKIFSGRSPGTFFVPSGLPMEAKKRWLAYFQRPTGTILVNTGAARALREGGKSLLAAGVVGVHGPFAAGDVVNLAVAGSEGDTAVSDGDPAAEVFARGVAGFGEDEIPRIAGKTSDELHLIYRSRKHLEVIHRDNLVLL
jgi:glutamate 5-kinase